MREDRNLYYIAALVDGEIQDEEQKQKLLNDIKNNPELQLEYNVQKFMKSLVSERLKISPAPAKVRKKLERKISPDRNWISSLLPEIFYTKPNIAWGTAIVILFAAFLILFNRTPQPEKKDFAVEQTGSDNMFVQAKSNFESILTGKLAPQLVSESPEEIKKFFKAQGVEYPTYIPAIKNWKLVGAVVSVDHGKKFAHHVYSTGNGKLVYLFQVNENDIKQFKFLKLTNDLLSYLNSGNCYETDDGKFVTLMTKINNNICAVVSNSSPDEIENNLCQLN